MISSLGHFFSSLFVRILPKNAFFHTFWWFFVYFFLSIFSGTFNRKYTFLWRSIADFFKSTNIGDDFIPWLVSQLGRPVRRAVRAVI